MVKHHRGSPLSLSFRLQIVQKDRLWSKISFWLWTGWTLIFATGLSWYSNCQICVCCKKNRVLHRASWALHDVLIIVHRLDRFCQKMWLHLLWLDVLHCPGFRLKNPYEVKSGHWIRVPLQSQKRIFWICTRPSLVMKQSSFFHLTFLFLMFAHFLCMMAFI